MKRKLKLYWNIQNTLTNNLIIMSQIIIYTANLCMYCTMAKRLLDTKGVKYTEINVDTNDQLREEMMQKTKRRTVPQIYIGEQHIGGFDDLAALDRQRGLDPLLVAYKE